MSWISSKFPFGKNISGSVDHPCAKVGHDVLKAVGSGKGGGGTFVGGNKLKKPLSVYNK
jgi:hypothetical protein